LPLPCEDEFESLFLSPEDSSPKAIELIRTSCPPQPSSILGHVLMRQDPLYPGSRVTLADALCTLFIFFITGHMAKAQLQRVLDLLHLFMPKNLLPTKVEGVLKLFGGSSDRRLVIHEYCESCFHSYTEKETECPNCQELRYRGGPAEQPRKKPKAFFIQLPLEQDLVDLFKGNDYHHHRHPLFFSSFFSSS